MLEIERIRIVEKDGYYHLERKVRKEWLPLMAENGKELTFLNREVAESYLGELSKVK